MKIKEILKKQGELYKNLPSNKIIKEYNEKIEKPTETDKSGLESIWTADFSEFREKVESIFGPIEILAEGEPDIYAHEVLSHGFIEYAVVTGITQKVKEKIAGSANGFHKALKSERANEYEQKYLGELKKEYMKWAETNNLAENLLEEGWQEFLND